MIDVRLRRNIPSLALFTLAPACSGPSVPESSMPEVRSDDVVYLEVQREATLREELLVSVTDAFRANAEASDACLTDEYQSTTVEDRVRERVDVLREYTSSMTLECLELEVLYTACTLEAYDCDRAYPYAYYDLPADSALDSSGGYAGDVWVPVFTLSNERSYACFAQFDAKRTECRDQGER